jgi:hypothetical protein
MSIHGKALLVITRIHAVGEKEHVFEVQPFIQSCYGGGEYRRDCVNESFQLIEYGGFAAPAAAYKLKEPGDTVRVYVVYQVEFIRGEWGYTDDDEELYYHKQRVLRWQPWSRNPRRKKQGPTP